MSDVPSRVCVLGPLAAFAQGFDRELVRQGHARPTRCHQLQLMAHLSRWMAAEEVTVAELSAGQVQRFVAARRVAGYRHYRSARGLAALLGYLRGRGVLPAPPVAAADQLERLVDRYRDYLLDERGLAPSTVRYYARIAGAFLAETCSVDGELDLAGVSADAVTRFLLSSSSGRSAGTVKNTVVGLRTLLVFLHRERLTGELAGVVPAVAPRPRGLPRALPPGTVARLVASCDRRSASGRRDYAVLMLLSRLGLRASEVAAIRISDVDWRDGTLLVRGKAGCVERMPLPVDVGQALAGYVRRGRPRVAGDRLFWRVIAPSGPMTSDGASSIVRAACRRCGLPVVGAHALRHTAATETLRAGGSLAEIGQLLRQQMAFTTAIYARVDHAALTALARPWPEPVR